MLTKLLRPLKYVARESLRSMGFEVLRTHHFPFGVSECRDICRFARGADQIQTIFDIGGNVGDLAIRFAGYFPKADIYSFEPIPATFEELRHNTASHSKVQCIPLAMGSSMGTSTVVLQKNSAINSLSASVNEIRRSESAGPEISVAVDTVDHFCEERAIQHIDILKSDTEGFDLEVLKGASGMLSKGKVSYVLVECDFDNWGLTSFTDLYAFCRQYGLHFIGLYESRFSPPPEPPRLWYTNALFSR